MQPGLAEVAGDVDVDPGAVFEAHGAESVDELVAGESAPERDSTSDRAVDRLFENDLDRPERSSVADEERADGGTTRACESTTTPAVLADLEHAIGATDGDDTTELDPADLEALEDADVADALAAAEELDGGAIDDGDLPDSVPEEWRDA